MKTIQLTTYEQFKAHDRPYLPRVEAGKLLIPNIIVNGHITGPKAKNRLIIETVVIHNRGAFVAVFSTCLSCQGQRQRWLYFVNGRRVVWKKLSFERQLTTMRAYFRYWHRSHNPEHVYPPTKHWRRWGHYLGTANLSDARQWGQKLATGKA